MSEIVLSIVMVLLLLLPLRGVAREPGQDHVGSFVRALLLHIPRIHTRKPLRWSVPVSVLAQFVRSELEGVLPESSDAPVPALFSRWHADVTLGDSDPAVALHLSGHAFRASPGDPVYVPLFPTTTVFSELTLNADPVEPMPQDGWFVAALHEPGPFTLTATLKMTAESDVEGRRLQFDKASCVVSTVRVRSQDDLDVHIEGEAGRLRGNDAGTRGLLAAGHAKTLSLRWRPRAVADEGVGTLSVTPSVAWTVGERILSARAWLACVVAGGGVESLVLRLPGACDNIRVSGPHVKRFRYAGGRLQIELRGAIQGRTMLSLSFDVRRPVGDQVHIPQLDVERGRVSNGGWLLVLNDTEGELLEGDVGGLRPAATLAMPEAVRGLATGKPLFAYAREARNPRQRFDLVSTTAFPMVDTIADSADMLTVLFASGEEMTRARYQVRNNRQQFLRLRLPEGARVLHATVEGKPCRLSRESGELLIPLAKSIQTLSGLISFPVEIVYCRQGGRLQSGRSGERRCALPVLMNAPTARMRATLRYPERLRLTDYQSALSILKEQDSQDEAITYGYGYQLEAGEQPADGPARIDESTLARNYYQVGYEAYKEGRLEDAESSFLALKALSADAVIATQAEDLLKNIQLGRGEAVGGKGRAQRAKAATIQRGLEGDNLNLEREQEELIDLGLEMLQEGEEEAGALLLMEAKGVGARLGARNASRPEQRAVAATFEKQLREAEAKKEENKALTARLSKVQKRTRDLLVAQTGQQSQVQAQWFAGALAESATANDIDLGTLQDAAFDPAPVSETAQGGLDERFLALEARGGRSRGKGRRKAKQPSLEDRNKELRRTVAALEGALSQIPNAPGDVSQKDRMSQTQRLQIRENIAEQRRKAEALIGQTALSADGMTNAMSGQAARLIDADAIETELAGLKSWSTANTAVFSAADKDVKQELEKLSNTLLVATRHLEAARKQSRHAKEQVVAVDEVFGRKAGRVEQQALQLFIAENYFADQTVDQQALSLTDGKLVVANDAGNAAMLATAIEKFQHNAGQAVRVSGRNLSVGALSGLPALDGATTGNMADGSRYAVLDEAQYRSLVAAEAVAPAAPGQQDVAPARENRDVIVGTPNTVGGQAFTLTRSGQDYNGLLINGTLVSLPHDKYLAIENGGQLTLLRGGRARDWQDAQGDAVDLLIDVEPGVEVPEIGVPIRFAKTYLEAGESPDVVITYSYQGGK